jgi:hypothetical protein
MWYDSVANEEEVVAVEKKAKDAAAKDEASQWHTMRCGPIGVLLASSAWAEIGSCSYSGCAMVGILIGFTLPETNCSPCLCVSYSFLLLVLVLWRLQYAHTRARYRSGSHACMHLRMCNVHGVRAGTRTRLYARRWRFGVPNVRRRLRGTGRSASGTRVV